MPHPIPPVYHPPRCLEQSRRHTRGQQLATCEAESRWQLCGRGISIRSNCHRIYIRSNCHLSSARGHGEGSSAGSDDSGSRWGGAAIGGSAGGWEPTLRLGFRRSSSLNHSNHRSFIQPRLTAWSRVVQFCKVNCTVYRSVMCVLHVYICIAKRVLQPASLGSIRS